jgi:hypothetical protein
VAACTKAVQYSNWQQLAGDMCEAYCQENGCAPPPPADTGCTYRWVPADQASTADITKTTAVLGGHAPQTQTVTAYGRQYTFVSIFDFTCLFPTVPRWRDIIGNLFDPRINPVDPVTTTNVLSRVNPGWVDIVKNMDTGWAIPTTLGAKSILPRLVVGNCQVARTTFSPVAAWISSASVLRSSAAASVAARSVLLEPRIAAGQNLEKLSLSLQPVSLVTGNIESCSGVGALASHGSGSDGIVAPSKTSLKPQTGLAKTNVFRSSSGSDGIYADTPKNTPLRQQFRSGAAGGSASRGSSGLDTVKSNTSNPAIDAVSSRNPYNPAARPPAPQGGAASARPSSGGSSSGFDTVKGGDLVARPHTLTRPSSSSSGFDTVKAGGATLARPSTSSGSSGISTVQSSGTSVPRQQPIGVVNPSAIDRLSTQRSGGAAVFRPPQQPSCNFGNCPK